MHNYHKYNFISPFRLYARIKEEMSSYFSTGIVDDLLFSTWTEDCIKKFRKTFLPIKQAAVFIENGEGTLPEDFNAIREAWTTTSRTSDPVVVDGSFYYPKDYQVVTSIDAPLENPCNNVCLETYEIVRKITNARVYTYSCTHRLQEGVVGCTSSDYIYEVDGCKLKTSGNTTCVHIIYYSDGTDDEGYQMIPDSDAMQKYIMAYITYMLHKQIFNQESGETFNQAERRKEDAKADMFHALSNAEIDSKKKTTQQKINDIQKSYRRHNKYRIR